MQLFRRLFHFQAPGTTSSCGIQCFRVLFPLYPASRLVCCPVSSRGVSGYGLKRTLHRSSTNLSLLTRHYQPRAHYAATNLRHLVRFMSAGNQGSTFRLKSANRNTVMYAVAIAIAVTGLSYAAVPLYRIFCQASGYGGTVVKVDAGEKVEKMEAIRERELTIRYVQ